MVKAIVTNLKDDIFNMSDMIFLSLSVLTNIAIQRLGLLDDLPFAVLSGRQVDQAPIL